MRRTKQQAEECLRLEEERVGNYLHPSTKPKLLKEVETEVLTKYEEQLLAKEHSGCAALLRDDKVRGWGGGARWAVQGAGQYRQYTQYGGSGA